MLIKNIFRKTLFDKYNKSVIKSFSQSILIKSGIIVNSDQSFEADILISDGKISKIIHKDSQEKVILPDNLRVVDAKKNYIIPGGIDTHTHFQLPFMGTVAVDDFNLGSRAALAGGTTCFLDFAIPSPGESLLKAYDKWRAWADSKVNCDYSLHMVISSWNDDIKREMGEVVKRGVSSFKVFLAYKGALMLGDSEFYHVLERCRELGALCMVHAENGELLSKTQKSLIDLGVTGPEGHYLSRPEIFEAEATHRAITIAEYLNAPLYIVHVMSQLAADEVLRARNRGNILFAETLAAGLAADGTQLWNKDWEIAAGHVMSPPINPDPKTKIELMRRLGSDNLQTVATDNCTFCNNQKILGKDDFSKIPNGVNGVEDRLSIVWTKGVKEGLLSPNDFVRVTSTKAAQLFNLYPKKGVIQEGADADLVIWNGEKERIISKYTHHQAVDFNVFEGMKVFGQSELTMTKGRIVWEDGKFTNELKQGSGRFVERKPFGFSFARQKEYSKVRDPRNFMVDRDSKEVVEEESENKKLRNEIDRLYKENLKLKEKIESSQNKIDESKIFDETGNFVSVDNALDLLPEGKIRDEVKRILLGKNVTKLPVSNKVQALAASKNFEIKINKIQANLEEIRKPRIVRIGAVQNRIVLPTTDPVKDQQKALQNRILEILEAAYLSGVNVICFQECWNTPFFMCTREKEPWAEFAESAHGESTKLLQEAARKYNMVIVSSILERDDVKEIMWNSAVIIDNYGNYLGKAHKNHIPRVGDFNESTYYMEGETGNPVFETDFGKIGVNICYGRHHPLHWQALGLNGAEIVFNPSATVSGLSEHLWGIEARCAAIANNYFAVGINRVGTEVFPHPFTSGDGKSPKREFGHFYGSSYITAPDGTRTETLSRTKDGILIAEVDLNHCRQVKDKWGFQMTSRTAMYAELLKKYSELEFTPQIIKKSKNNL